MHPQIPLLRSNLQELWCAAKTTPHDLKEPLPVVASYFTNNIYDSRSGYGRFWKWIYSIAAYLQYEDLEKESLKRAMQATQEIYLQTLDEAHKSSAAYLEMFQSRANGEEIDTKAYVKAQQHIVEWNLSTRPFIRLLQKNSDIEDRITHVALRALFLDNLYTDLNFFTSTPKYQPTLDSYRILALENSRIPSLTIPLQALLNSLEPNPPQEDSGKIKTWIADLNASRLPLRLFKHAIDAIISAYGDKQVNSSCVELHKQFHKLGLNIYEQDDPKSVALLPGTEILFDRTKCTILESLDAPGAKRDFQSYTLVDQPEKILVVGKNKMTLAMKPFLKVHRIIINTMPDIPRIFSKNGLYCIVDGLIPLQSYKWTASDGKMNEADKTKASRLGVFLNDCAHYNHKMPQGLMTNAWFYCRESYVVSLDIPDQMHSNFDELEDFALQCSQGNRSILKHMLEMGGMSDKNNAAFYQDVVETVLLNKPKDLEAIKSKHSIHRDSAQIRAKAMQQTLRSHLKKYPEKGQQLFVMYKTSGSIGNLSAFEQVLAATQL